MKPRRLQTGTPDVEQAVRRMHAGDLAGAELLLRKALQRSPADAVAHNVLGLVHMERRDYVAAIASYQNAMRLRQPFPEAMINLSVACNRTGEHVLAQQLCELVLHLSPGHPLALVNLGMACKGQRHLKEAVRAFEAAASVPMARFNLGHTLLLQDDLERGLPLFEERRAVMKLGAGLRGRPWDGSAQPESTLLVVPEQGLGDIVLMSRFLGTLAERFATVIVQCPAPLAPLLATIDARVRVVTSLAEQRWDVWAPIMSLPFLLGIRAIADVPTRPWIGVEDAPRAAGTLRVGINWAGNPSYAYDHVRSTSLETFAPLLAIADVEWVSLHRGVREHEAEAFGLAQPLAQAKDFLDTARVLAGLDLVLSTETAIPNLSAAMGIPTGVLSVRDVDWRWTGWYEGVTVCAQEQSGNWYGPIAKAAALVQDLLVAREAARAA